MITRTLEKKLRELAGYYPAVVVTGPRQSGKTTLSARRLFGNTVLPSQFSAVNARAVIIGVFIAIVSLETGIEGGRCDAMEVDNGVAGGRNNDAVHPTFNSPEVYPPLWSEQATVRLRWIQDRIVN